MGKPNAKQGDQVVGVDIHLYPGSPPVPGPHPYSGSGKGGNSKGARGKGGKDGKGRTKSRYATTRTKMALPAWQTPPPDWGNDAKKSPLRDLDTQVAKPYATAIWTMTIVLLL